MSDVLKGVKFVKGKNVSGKRVLLRVDFNVVLGAHGKIANDERIRQALPTIELLLKNGNRLVVMSHLGRPKGREAKFSLKNVAERLEEYLAGYKVRLVEDFYDEKGKKMLADQGAREVLMLENLRFYPGEKGGLETREGRSFSQDLASLCDVYVNDAFGVCHRKNASVVGVSEHVPSYGGLLLEREVGMISKAIDVPRAPVVAIIGGAKISTKVPLLSKLVEISDDVIVGGALANTFLLAEGVDVGKSLVEPDQVKNAKKILKAADKNGVTVWLPEDVVVGMPDDMKNGGEVVGLDEVPKNKMILDVGPKTQAVYGKVISAARTIIWNGPIGYNENPQYVRGTDFSFYSIANNDRAMSVVGGGDTIASISKKEYLDKITHISTGGGAMLAFIEHGTLPGIEALRD